jgi:1,4-dihydroxy-2-naphthoate octaprenyltransferase
MGYSGMKLITILMLFGAVFLIAGVAFFQFVFLLASPLFVRQVHHQQHQPQPGELTST